MAVWTFGTMSKQYGNPEWSKVKIVPYINPWVEVEELEKRVKQATGKCDLKWLPPTQ